MGTWTCPVCDGPAKYDDLILDGYFQEVIKADELPEEENEIILNQDGSWNPVPKDEEAERRKNEVLVDLSDEEGGEDEGGSKPKKEEPEDLGIPNVAVGTPPPTASGNPADIECIDIE